MYFVLLAPTQVASGVSTRGKVNSLDLRTFLIQPLPFPAPSPHVRNASSIVIHYHQSAICRLLLLSIPTIILAREKSYPILSHRSSELSPHNLSPAWVKAITTRRPELKLAKSYFRSEDYGSTVVAEAGDEIEGMGSPFDLLHIEQHVDHAHSPDMPKGMSVVQTALHSNATASKVNGWQGFPGLERSPFSLGTIF